MASVAMHLIVLVNGLWGGPSDWAQLETRLRDALPPGQWLVHVSRSNRGRGTFAGERQSPWRLTQLACRSPLHGASTSVVTVSPNTLSRALQALMAAGSGLWRRSRAL